MMGYWIPPGLMAMEPGMRNLVDNPTTVQFVHRILAWLLGAGAVCLWVAAFRSHLLPRQHALVNLVCALVVVQFFLGVVTLVLRVPVAMATVHQVVACLLVGACVGLFRSFLLIPEVTHTLEPTRRSGPEFDAGHPGPLGPGSLAERTA
jgi:cytochrome c oxidase assembly protein subunit 15